ncbi:hypothetical protein UPYG_G00024300 [Umbra pygmaea]|uniref:DUF4592 domain-containing protein n=1 Tax=Umbra pygmaea TaxID=75934 RepID=A0ABD0XLJ6_UMBPY
MESSTGNVEGSREDLTGRKKSRFKLLKSRLFSRLRRKDTEGLIKQSQSVSDVTTDVIAQRADIPEEDCLASLGTLGSRALSHDSIFLADQSQSSDEPTRVLSQENVHGRIRELQLKLQLNKMHLGPPPLLILGKRMEDSGANSEDDGLPQSPPDISFHDRTASTYKFSDSQKHHSSLSLAGTGSEEEEQPLPQSFSPNTTPPGNLVLSSPTDFTSPAQYTPSLDSSAARHRMAVKPRNQRASTKARKGPLRACRPGSESLSDLDQPLSEREEEQERTEDEENMEREQSLSVMAKDPEEMPWESAPPGDQIDVSQRQESLEPDAHITTNPLYLQDMPLLADLFPVAEPRLEATSQPTLASNATEEPRLEATSQPTLASNAIEEPQKLLETILVQPPSAFIDSHRLQRKTDIQDSSVQGNRPRSTSENSFSGPLSTVCKSDMVNNKRDSWSQQTYVSLGDTISPPQLSAFPTPAPRFTKQTPKPVSEKEPSTETTIIPTFGVNKENHKQDLTQRTTEPPTGQKSILSGSHSFSISSMKQRHKTTTGMAHTGTSDKGLKWNQPPIPQERKSKVKTEAGVLDETELTGKKTDGHSGHTEEEEPERRHAFGVKLRTTSHSLKYRSERNPELKVQRNSVEVLSMTTAESAGSEFDASFDGSSDSGSKAWQKAHPQVYDSAPSSTASSSYTPDSIRKKETLNPLKLNDMFSSPALGPPMGPDSPASAVSEPAWMSAAQENTCSLQQNLTPESGTGVKTPQYTSSPGPTSQPTLQPIAQQPMQPPTQLQPSTQTPSQNQASHRQVQPTSQPKPRTRPILWGLQLAAKLKTLPSEQPNIQPASQLTAEQMIKLSNQPQVPTTRGASKKSSTSLKGTKADRTPLTETKGGSDTGQTEMNIEKHEISSSTSSQSSSSSRQGQPTWMELAKRKAMAWSDNTTD